jgi:manganese/zinc/iron transport system ATP- binding protein
MDCTTAVSITHLTVTYGAKLVLDDISVAIPRGVICALIGPNGAGKSSLFHAIVGLVRPLAGIITIDGMSGAKGRNLIAYVPQRAAIDWHFPISVFDVVMMGRYATQGFFKRATVHDSALVKGALKKVGMELYADRLIGELSGGQQQRVFLARALVQERPIMMLDEPFTGVDAVTEAVFIEVLKTLRSQGATVILVHHAITAVAAYADWAILLQTKLIKAGPIAAVTTHAHLTDAYGHAIDSIERAP